MFNNGFRAIAVVMIVFLTACGGNVTIQPNTELTELVNKSEAIVIGQIWIVATEDGHVGEIKVSQTLHGDITKDSISFFADPRDLVEDQEQIWFLEPDTHNEWRILYGKSFTSLSVDKRTEVEQAIAEKK
jgi:hypothetical protein